MLYYLLAPLVVGSICVYWSKIRLRKHNDTNHKYPTGTHVVISGGSKGIGKSLAKRFAELGAHVTIIARNEDDLKAAKIEIEKHRKNSLVQCVRTVSLDLTKISFPNNSNSDASKHHRELLEKLLGEHDRCDILINCCGSSIPARFEDTSQQQFEFMMQVNYFSAVNLTRILLPSMKTRCLTNFKQMNPEPRIVFVSSICGLLSFFGYSGYSASKFALVGLAEALHMELKPFGIGVTISFPPDTDTPGFEAENRLKPSLTSKMSETGNVYTPDEVANSLVKDIRMKKFYSTVGFENLCVLMSMNTFMPTTSIWRALMESLIATPLKLVGFFILKTWYKLVDEAAGSEINIAKINLKCSKNVKYDEKSHKDL